ncbi:hypothetical protein Tco_1195391 [Tanacetum coccineum]
MPITTAEEKAQRRLEVKARSTLMMSILNEYQLKFNSIKDAKKLLEAVKKRFGGNEATKKTQRNLLKIKGMSSLSSSTQNIDFVSSSNNNTSSTNEAVNTTHGVSTASTQVNAANSINIDNFSDAANDGGNRWNYEMQNGMLIMRVRRFLKNTEKKLTVKGNETIGFDKSKVNYVSSMVLIGKDMNSSDQAEEGPNMHLRHSSLTQSLNKLIECQIVDNCKKGLGYEKYNAVPPPYTRNFMPPTPDLSFTGLDEFVNKPVVENRKSDKEVSEIVRKNDDAPIIEEWVSDSEEENVSQPKTVKKIFKPSIAKIEFVKSKQQEKTARKTVKQAEKHRQNTHSPRGNQRNWNNMMSQRLGSNFEMFNKACYVCGSFDHLQVDCNYHQKQFQNQRMVKPVWNNAQRVNHQNFAKKTHPCAKKNMVPRAVLMKSGLVSINTARQVNAAHSKSTVNAARPMSYLSRTTHLTVKRPIHKNTTFKNSNIYQRVNIARDKKFNTARPKAVVNDVKENSFNAVQGLTCWVWKHKTKGFNHYLNTPWPSITLKKFDYVDAQGQSTKRFTNQGGGLIVESSRHNNRTPTLSFMRPFGCPGTILNTIDHLGKFDVKADEGTQSTWFSQVQKQDLKSSHDDGSKPSSDDGKKVNEDPRKDSECNDQEKEDNV